MTASSCASCQNSWEIPAPVPSRPLLPSLEAEHTQAVENSTCPHKQDGTGSLPYLQGSLSKWGTGWSLQCSLGFSRSCPRHRGDMLLPLWGKSSPVVKLRKRERFQLSDQMHTHPPRSWTCYLGNFWMPTLLAKALPGDLHPIITDEAGSTLFKPRKAPGMQQAHRMSGPHLHHCYNLEGKTFPNKCPNAELPRNWLQE